MKTDFAVVCALHSRRDGASNCMRGKPDSAGHGCASSSKGHGHRVSELYRSTALGVTCSTAESPRAIAKPCNSHSGSHGLTHEFLGGNPRQHDLRFLYTTHCRYCIVSGQPSVKTSVIDQGSLSLIENSKPPQFIEDVGRPAGGAVEVGSKNGESSGTPRASDHNSNTCQRSVAPILMRLRKRDR